MRRSDPKSRTLLPALAKICHRISHLYTTTTQGWGTHITIISLRSATATHIKFCQPTIKGSINRGLIRKVSCISYIIFRRGNRYRIRSSQFKVGTYRLRLTQITDRPRHCRTRSEEHTSELQSRGHLVCRLLLEKKN